MAKAEDKQKDMFAMGFDELVNSVDANANKPATAEVDPEPIESKHADEHESKPAEEHESNMINAFDDSTQALTDDLKVDPEEDNSEEAPVLNDDVVQDDSPVDINIFGQTSKQEKDAPDEFNNLKQVTNAVSEDAKPAAHGKIFGESSSVHTPSKPHGKVFGGPVSGSVESKPVETPSHGKDFSAKVAETETAQTKVEQPKVEQEKPEMVEQEKSEMVEQEKPKTEKAEAKPAKKAKASRKAKAVESKGKAMKDETKVVVNDDNIEITLPLNAKVIGLLGKDGVTDAVSEAVKDFNASASKELQSAATKELKTLF